MTLPRVEALNRYQEQWPPIHKMVAAYLGVKAKAKPTVSNVEEFIALSMAANMRT